MILDSIKTGISLNHNLVQTLLYSLLVLLIYVGIVSLPRKITFRFNKISFFVQIFQYFRIFLIIIVLEFILMSFIFHKFGNNEFIINIIFALEKICSSSLLIFIKYIDSLNKYLLLLGTILINIDIYFSKNFVVIFKHIINFIAFEIFMSVMLLRNLGYKIAIQYDPKNTSNLPYVIKSWFTNKGIDCVQCYFEQNVFIYIPIILLIICLPFFMIYYRYIIGVILKFLYKVPKNELSKLTLLDAITLLHENISLFFAKLFGKYWNIIIFVLSIGIIFSRDVYMQVLLVLTLMTIICSYYKSSTR